MLPTCFIPKCPTTSLQSGALHTVAEQWWCDPISLNRLCYVAVLPAECHKEVPILLRLSSKALQLRHVEHSLNLKGDGGKNVSHLRVFAAPQPQV